MMKKNQLSLDHLSMIRLYVEPQKSKEVILNQMIQSQSIIKENHEFKYENKVLEECIEFIKELSSDEIQQLDFSEVLVNEEFVE